MLLRRHISAFILGMLAICGCSKVEAPIVFSDLPIEFSAEEPLTKSFPMTTTAEGFKCTALQSTGSPLFSNLITGVSDGRSTTGYYWPVNSSLSFYGVHPSSCTLLATAKGATISVGSASAPFGGSTDVIAMKKENVAYGTTPIPVTFNHILAGVDHFYLDFQSFEEYYCAYVWDATLVYPAYGTYNLLTGTWTTGGTTDASSGFVLAEESDNYEFISDTTFIPGTVTLTMSYDIECDGVTVSYDKSASINLVQGQISTVRVLVPHNMAQLEVSVSVKDWTPRSSYSETI